MTINEADIRDRLSTRLDILEPNLSLLKIEKYVPNPDGTRGFIDILAKDDRNRYVLIELKRSSASSRDALHEALKYAEGVKRNLAVNDDEFRILVVSTDWTELLVPFSSLVKKVEISVAGYLLEINNDGTPIKAEKVVPIPLAKDRLFSPLHEINLYTSFDSMQKGVDGYESACKQKKVDNYVLVALESSAGHRSQEINVMLTFLNSMSDDDDQLTSAQIEAMMPQYTHMLYFAYLEIEDRACLDTIKSILLDSPEELEDFLCMLQEEDTGSESYSAIIQNRLMECAPWPYREHFDIGSPAKFGTKILDDEGWKIIFINRYGAIQNNSLLKEASIIRELRGEQGITRQRYVKELVGNAPSDLSVVRSEIEKCLEGNPIWKSQIIYSLQELTKLSPSSNTRISIYNPSNIIFSLFMFITRPDGALYIPSYQIISETENTLQIILGCLGFNDRAPSMKSILDKYYDSDPFLMLRPLNWGGYEVMDARIVRDVGLTYETYKKEISSGQESFWKLTELGWEECEPVTPLESLERYLQKHTNFIADIHELFSKNWNGAWVSYDKDKKIIFNT